MKIDVVHRHGCPDHFRVEIHGEDSVADIVAAVEREREYGSPIPVCLTGHRIPDLEKRPGWTYS